MEISATHPVRNPLCPLVLFGAGGHGKVVIDAASTAGLQFDWLVDDEPRIQELHGIPVIKTDKVPWGQWEAFDFIVAIGDNKLRAKAWHALLEKGGLPINVIHRAAVISTHARIGQGNFIAAGVIVGVDSIIEDNCILNTGAAVDHDCKIGSHVHLAPGVHLSGGVEIGPGTLLGVGVSVIPRVIIGEWSIVGAGSTVLRSLPNHVTAYGTPAKTSSNQDR